MVRPLEMVKLGMRKRTGLERTGRGVRSAKGARWPGWKREIAHTHTNLRPERLSGRLEEWHPTCLSNPWRGIMDLNGRRVFEQQDKTAREKRAKADRKSTRLNSS